MKKKYLINNEDNISKDNDYKCVHCGNYGLVFRANNFYCKNSICVKYKNEFYKVNNKTIFIDFDSSVVKSDFLISSNAISLVKRSEGAVKNSIKRILRNRNKITEKNIEFLDFELSKIRDPKILIIGGGEIGHGLDNFYQKYKSNIISFDIYHSENIDFIADAHNIPLVDSFFDLVIVQAVLEHVINPYIVVSEISRVLKSNGIVYAETPFMQQVHEGAYDYLRFSESGHRYLFKNFSLIDSGYVLGAGSSLLWSIDYFFSGLFRSRLVGKIFRYTFFWLSKFDNFIPDKYNIDAACGVFFLGRKSNCVLKIDEIVNHYKGNQRL